MPSERASSKTSKRLPRRVAVAVVSLLVAFALVAGLSRPAGRYFYCEAMGVLPFDPCAAAAADRYETVAPGEETSSITASRSDCCSVVTIESPAQAVNARALSVLPAPLVALSAPPVSSRMHVLASTPTRRSGLERWRLPPRPPGQARAELMVFLT